MPSQPIPLEILAESALAQTRQTRGRRRVGQGLAILTAAALMVASAFPARADQQSDRIAKWVVGTLVLGAILNEIDHEDRRHNPPPSTHRRVPGVCAIEIDSRERRHPVVVYGGHCLRDHGLTRLPGCGREVRFYGQPDRIYSEPCLRGAGFRLPS